MSRKNFLIGALLHQTLVLSIFAPIFYHLGFSTNERARKHSMIALVAFYGGIIFGVIGSILQYVSYMSMSIGLYYTGLVIEIIGGAGFVVAFYKFYLAAKVLSNGIEPKLILAGAFAPIIVGLFVGIGFVLMLAVPSLYNLEILLMYFGFEVGLVLTMVSADGFLLLSKE